MDYFVYIFINYFIDGGAWIMIPIFSVSLIGWYLIISKFFEIDEITKSRKKFIKYYKQQVEKDIPNDEYSYLLEKLYREKFTQQSFYNFYREFLITTIPKVDSKFSAISSWVSVSPLLGLLGTVSGMIETFKIITEFGLGNPNLTAQGISIALITTQAGLFVAFPLIIAQNHIKNRAKVLKNAMYKDGEILIKQFEEIANV